MEFAARIDLDPDEFDSKMSDPTYQDRDRADFANFHRIHINGFSAVVIKTETGTNLLSQGYVDYAELIQRLHQFMTGIG